MAYIDKREWKVPSFDGLCPNVLDWARAAAYIDGEGSVLINPRRHRKDYSTEASGFYLKITVANTDIRLLMWFKENFGGTVKDSNTEKYYEGKNWKRAYNWSASSSRASWILFNCLPYFILKGEQAGIGIQLQESMGVTMHGRSLSPEMVERRRSLKKQLLILKAKGVKMQPEQQERIEQVS
jgi:hypothetical protein